LLLNEKLQNLDRLQLSKDGQFMQQAFDDFREFNHYSQLYYKHCDAYLA